MKPLLSIRLARDSRSLAAGALSWILQRDLERLLVRMQKVEGWLTKAEAAGLYSAVRALPSLTLAVEIGSWHGKSSIMIAGALRARGNGGKLYALDPFIGAEGYAEGRGPSWAAANFLDSFRRNIASASLAPFVTPVQGYSYETVKTWRQPVEFLFIDGDHEYEQVSRDFLDWSPHVKVGGLIAFHDSNGHWPGPTRVVNEGLRPPTWEVTLRVDSLTVAQRRLTALSEPALGKPGSVSHDQAYNPEFYQALRQGTRTSARVVLPIVLELVNPKSVVDVGCGDGSWLAVLHELGLGDTLGVDGGHIDAQILRIPKEQFRAVDLSKPFKLDRFFDLAMSLEVAEHLPPQAAEDFVRSLTQLAPVVLFSAAIPFQRGVQHVNKQWPEYWANLFRQHDYLPIDCLRGKIWQNGDVEWWYAQNALIFAHVPRIDSDPVLRREFERTNLQQLCLVHPRNYLEAVQPPPPPKVGEAFSSFATALRRSLLYRLQRRLKRTDNA